MWQATRKTCLRPLQPIAENRIWTYLPYGPFASVDDCRGWIEKTCLGDDPLFHAIIDGDTGRAVGVASYLRIEPAVGVIEVGHINYAPALQKTRGATEAMYLMMRRVFGELGYRRYEWKCDALNAGSCAAADDWVLPTKASSARRPCTRAATGIPTGTRYWTPNGRRWNAPMKRGWTRQTLMRRGAEG